MSDFEAQMHQIVSRLGLHSKPRWVAHSAPDSLAGFCGLLIVERRGVEGRKERRRVRKDERGSGGRGSVLRSDFYLNVTTLRSGLCCRNSVCHLSSVVCLSVCNVGAPYSGGWTFSAIFFHRCVRWPSRDLRAKFYGDRPGRNPPSEALNARGVTKYSDFRPIEGYIS